MDPLLDEVRGHYIKYLNTTYVRLLEIEGHFILAWATKNLKESGPTGQ